MSPVESGGVSSSAGTPRRVGIIGAGMMGAGIGAELALRLPGVEEIRIWDPAEGVAERAVTRVPDVARLLAEAGLFDLSRTEEKARALRAAGTREEALEGAEYVVEAVPEQLPLKREVFGWIDRLAPAEAVIASNTSSFDPAALAEGLSHPERVLVTHYFGPAYLIPAVEVVPHAGTEEWARARTLALLEGSGKQPVPLSRYLPGFIANRLQQALFREALHLAREGIATPEEIDSLVRFSFGARLAALGPFSVPDFGGMDVYAGIIGSVWPTLNNDAALPPEVAERVSSGNMGIKTGAGLRDWSGTRLEEAVTRRDAALVRLLKDSE